MCIQCAAGAMTAVAGASGMRMWLEARFPFLTGARTKKVLRRIILAGGVLAASLLGSSTHVATSSAAPSPGSAAPVVRRVSAAGPDGSAATPVALPAPHR